MPRKPRFELPGIPVHVVQRGNNRQATFFDDADCHMYLRRLAEGAEEHACAVHAYCLMTNHVHLLVTMEEGGSVSRLMQYLGRRYVQYVNRRYGRSGTLWDGRYRASLIQADAYLLACYRYIELNPVRAGMVGDPAEYRWSSYRGNALGERDPLLTPHPLYLSLAEGRARRVAHYREFCLAQVDDPTPAAIRSASRSGTPLGDERFRSEVEASLGRKVGRVQPGRPPKGF